MVSVYKIRMFSLTYLPPISKTRLSLQAMKENARIIKVYLSMSGASLNLAK